MDKNRPGRTISLSEGGFALVRSLSERLDIGPDALVELAVRELAQRVSVPSGDLPSASDVVQSGPMLIVTQQLGEAIVCHPPDGMVKVVFIEEGQGRVRLAIDCPREMHILRGELRGTPAKKR